MNSKGIQPRVGMVYAFNLSDHYLRVITGFCNDGCCISTDENEHSTNINDFIDNRRGRYEIIWSEEIRDAMLGSERPEDFEHFDGYRQVFPGHQADCEICNDNWNKIRESLAYDGTAVDE